eukprot:CAMPEP_0174381152 /NCGR_PEP_ID=MMETSP0811_2-20130205/123825_1 /TAXON_ID=73025 ORGANISM="Eutreptiella gymnastica-like, Strain CCMP1594" /NCGR_SAMPLE_ID=MMETSP0811_2 /ASSEMBLY_ACC=CAM_ASM_000667 /LENGTH=52 /DNA_ID=CAMNT_0015534211 /DNA_START=3284 /DNA_END=3442 /DNA_ORIENTATION=-
MEAAGGPDLTKTGGLSPPPNGQNWGYGCPGGPKSAVSAAQNGPKFAVWASQN